MTHDGDRVQPPHHARAFNTMPSRAKAQKPAIPAANGLKPLVQNESQVGHRNQGHDAGQQREQQETDFFSKG